MVKPYEYSSHFSYIPRHNFQTQPYKKAYGPVSQGVI